MSVKDRYYVWGEQVKWLIEITYLNWLVRIVESLDSRIRSEEGLNLGVDKTSNLLYQQGGTEKLLVNRWFIYNQHLIIYGSTNMFS